MQEKINEIKDALEDMSTSARLIFSHLEDLEDYNNPLIDYINELEKDYYFRAQSCKDNLTVDKIVDDLIRLVKEIKE